jgi:hypothetical protein
MNDPLPTDPVTPMPAGNYSAFPLMPPWDATVSAGGAGYPYPETGLTKRELFAALAMQALCETMVSELAAKDAVMYADALLRELAK